MQRKQVFLAAAAAASVALASTAVTASASAVPQGHGPYAATNVVFAETLTATRDGVTRAASADNRPDANVYGPKNFTPQSNTFSAKDSDGNMQAKYNYVSPGTFSWRYTVASGLCTGATLQGLAVANVYNNGGLVPNTHYSKGGVSPCYGFHSSYPGNTKINTKGNYELSGGLTFKKGKTTYNLDFVLRFDVTLV
jgi:hypothetical protein